MDLKACFDWVVARLSFISSPLNESRHLLEWHKSIEDLKELETTMHRIQALIRDSEENGFRGEWLRLKELKDVAYDADDVMDEYAYLLSRGPSDLLREAGSSKRKYENMKEKVYFVRPEWQGLVDKAAKILKEYDNINTQWDNLRLQEADGDMRRGVNKNKIMPTSSLLHETEIVGRGDDKEKVIKMVFAENAELCTVSVLPIIGMTGIGKTTLAQLVSNDPRVHESFELHGWVFVGGNFDVVTLTKKIIVTFTSKNCDLTELNELHKKMEEVVRGKRFFLVLDDVLNDTTEAWGILLAPLVRAQSGRVVVTSHDKEVAKIRQKSQSYSLDYLPFEDCWSLFRKLAFEGKENPDPVLLKYGRTIVEKCKGLPMAVKAVGTTLFFENDEENWNYMLKSDLLEMAESGDVIFQAMKLSYDRMPIHLKQCLLLFSLFPKGHVFSKDKIIRLWMSLGFLGEYREMENFGKRCLDELLRFSIIQNSEAVDFFSLHDIVHSIVQSIAGIDFMIMDEDTLIKIKNGSFEVMEIRKKRYLSMIHSLENVVGFQILKESNKLRLLQLIGFNNNCMNISIPNELFDYSTHLRNLDFSNVPIDTLPEPIGYLIHLRSLVLTNTGIEKLPETICSLINLQTLDLMGCPIHELPGGINNLFKLRHLIFENSNYICMPVGILRLKALRTLTRFKFGKCWLHCWLRDLNMLANLEGELCIGGLENVQVVEKVRLPEKVNILRLDWSRGEHGQCKHRPGIGSTLSNPLPDCVDSKIHDDVFENLKPSSALKELHIHNYCGSIFPRWLGDASFTRLVKISIVGAQDCSCIPTLDQLLSLKTLFIQSLPSVKHVDCQCSCDGVSKGFPSLEYLEFSDMLNWVDWFGAEDMEFIKLSTLRIIDCPMLRNLPAPLFSSLTKLVIKDCGNLALPALPSLKSLTLKGELNQNMFSNLDFPSLRTMKVCYSNNIRSINFSLKVISLEVLVIHSCRNLQLVSGFGLINSLKLFKIHSCHKVKFSLTEEIPSSVQRLDISDCPMLEGWELFHKRKLIAQLCNDGDNDEELEARAELSEAESEDDSDADDSQ